MTSNYKTSKEQTNNSRKNWHLISRSACRAALVHPSVRYRYLKIQSRQLACLPISWMESGQSHENTWKIYITWENIVFNRNSNNFIRLPVQGATVVRPPNEHLKSVEDWIIWKIFSLVTFSSEWCWRMCITNRVMESQNYKKLAIFPIPSALPYLGGQQRCIF